MSRKKFISRILTLLLVAMSIFVGSTQRVLAEEEKTFIIGTDTTYAPFEFVDESGEMVGIDMDILAAIAEDQGFNYEIRALGFSAALQALESNQVDGVIAGMGITDARKEIFDFSSPYFSSGSQFAVGTNSDIESFADLEGLRVAVKTGTTGYEVAEELSAEYGFTLNPFDDSVNMYEDLTAGNSQAVVEDFPVMLFASSTGQVNLKLIEEQQRMSDFGFAVNKDMNRELLSMFNEGLANIQASGEYDEIVARYLGEEALAAQSDTGNIFTQFTANAGPLFKGLWTTIWVTLISFAIALLVGFIIGLMRTSDNKLFILLAKIYIDIMRGSPLIVLAFFIYFGIPQLTGLTFGAATAGIITLSLNATAYVAEIIRGGIQAVDIGQVEAGRSLGLTNSVTMRKIILPQATKISLPSLINQFVITLKDTSILSVIGLVELTQTGKIIIARTYQSGNMWVIVGIMYIVLIKVLTVLSDRIEGEL